MYTKLFIFEKRLVIRLVFWYNKKRKMISNLFLLFFAEEKVWRLSCLFFTLIFMIFDMQRAFPDRNALFCSVSFCSG